MFPLSFLTAAPDLANGTGEIGRVRIRYVDLFPLLALPNRPDGSWAFVGGNGGAFLLLPDPDSSYVKGDALIDTVGEWIIQFPDHLPENRDLIFQVFGYAADLS